MIYSQLQEYIGENLRYISLGWTRIHAYQNRIESHSIDAAKNESCPADIYLEFGNQLDKILRLRCECVYINHSDLYRLTIQSFHDRTLLPESMTSILVGELIEEIQLYETFLNENNERPNDHPDLFNGAVIKFKHDKYLILMGTEGDGQYEPCIIIEFKMLKGIDGDFDKWKHIETIKR